MAICSDVSRIKLMNMHADSISCKGIYIVDFNKETLRFLMSNFVGFTDGDSNENTPTITIGKCSAL